MTIFHRLLTLEEENESKEKKGAEKNGSLHNLYEPDKSDTGKSRQFFFSSHKYMVLISIYIYQFFVTELI